MGFSVRVDSESGWVEARQRGFTTYEEMLESRRLAVELLAKHNLLCVLVDNREADFSGVSVTEALKFASSHHLAFVAVSGVRVAVLSRLGHLEAANMSEAVARKNGVDLRVFLDVDEGRRWLKEHRLSG